jgi:hypothetical protein
MDSLYWKTLHQFPEIFGSKMLFNHSKFYNLYTAFTLKHTTMSSTDDPVSIWKSKPKGEKIAIECVVVAEVLLILFVVGSKFFTGPNQTSTPGNQKVTYSKLYTVNSDFIYAATSTAAFDMMMNCITNKDNATLSRMVSSGDLIYLRRGDVVVLYKVRMKYFVVHQESSTDLLYVLSEHLIPQ